MSDFDPALGFVTGVAATPEPASFALIAMGLAGLGISMGRGGTGSRIIGALGYVRVARHPGRRMPKTEPSLGHLRITQPSWVSVEIS